MAYDERLDILSGRSYVHRYKYAFYTLPGEKRNISDCLVQIESWKSGWHQSVYYAAAYLLIVFLGPRLVRKPYDLRVPLILWNAFLSSWSIFGALRFSPHFLATVSIEGFEYSVCVCDYFCDIPGYQTELFGFSKVAELFDTAFLILRQKPISLVHWFHHATVLIFTWHSIAELTGPGRWFVGMNYMVHSIMYPYYTIRAIGFRVPKVAAMGVTILQLAQMFMGCYLSVFVLKRKLSGGFCDMTWENLCASLSIYSVYLVLFAKFFADAYFGCKKFGHSTRNDFKRAKLE